MTGAQFRGLREYLGLDQEWLARRLDVGERSIRRWEAGAPTVPPGIQAQLREWEKLTERKVGELIQQLTTEADPTWRVFHEENTDESDFWPSRWNRHVMARVAAVVPDLTIGYTTADPATGGGES